MGKERQKRPRQDGSGKPAGRIESEEKKISEAVKTKKREKKMKEKQDDRLDVILHDLAKHVGYT